jgi:phage regulator Rha-like protein
VETRLLKQAVRRNADRFPEDFMIELQAAEWKALRSQTVILENKSKYKPFAFTEHGVTMLASVLRSERAVQMNIAIVRAFIAMRSMAMHYKELAEKIMAMEQLYDKQFSDIYEALRYLSSEKEPEKDWASRERIGFKKT